MKSKAIRLRAVAHASVEVAFEHYLPEAGVDVASGFMDALEFAYGHIAKHPGTGSRRYAVQLGIPALRSWMLNRFPYLVFYIEGPEFIDVVNVLHGAMDIPEWLEY